MSSTPQFDVAQLTAARSEHWHQRGDALLTGNALLTLDAAREWVNEAGLVLFAPRGQQLAMPAPSLVEATLGKAVSAPTAAESETARGLVARMVAEGSVLPLNLLGGPGDVPDFVVAAPMFGFVFTLRGDKNWKQPPSTSGAVKVSPLALKVYEALAQGNAMTAAELVRELGREVTESAIVRALGELWAQMRVIPLLEQDGGATMWELTSRRFTKLLKAGANAGQPTALSALISAYLAQVFAATEEEIETFLSPLSARSRVRDVLHGLTAARQLENAVLEGKTLLYIPGALPEFPEIAVEAAAAEDETPEAPVEAAGQERIRRFDRPRGAREERGTRPPRREARPPRAEGDERPFRRKGPAKPFGERKREGGGERKGFGGRGREQGARGKSFGERERRPFQRDRAERGRSEGGEQQERQSFARPWDEERKARPRRDEGERREGARPFRKDGERAGGEFRGKREFGGKPQFGKGPKRDFGARPRREESDRREGGERPFRPREGAGGERPFRPRREGSAEGRPFRARREGDSGERPFRPRREGNREGGGARPAKPFRRREEGTRESGKRPFRSAEGGERSGQAGERRAGSRPGGKPAFGGRPGFGGKPKFGAKRGPGGSGAGKGGFGGKGKFGGKPKPTSRGRDVRAKDMRPRDKGERPRGPRNETEE